MDITPFAIGAGATACLMLLGLLPKTNDTLTNYLLAIFAGFGVIIGAYWAVSVLADGSITAIVGSVPAPQTLASAANANLWEFISLGVVILPTMSGMVALYRIYKGFSK